MADYDDVPYIVVERRSGGLGAFFWGALIGAGVALLYAPRSGRETRAEIRGGADRIRRRAEDSVRNVQQSFTDTIDGIRQEVTGRIDEARDAIQVGKDAARQTRHEMEVRLRQSREAVRAGVDAARSADRPQAGPGEPVTRFEVEGGE